MVNSCRRFSRSFTMTSNLSLLRATSWSSAGIVFFSARIVSLSRRSPSYVFTMSPRSRVTGPFASTFLGWVCGDQSGWEDDVCLDWASKAG